MRQASLSFPFLLAGAAIAQEKITYQDHVRPIFENRCLNCHNPDKKKGGLDLSTYGATLAGGSGGVCVEPGEPKDVKLLQCVMFTAEPFMPPKSDKIPQGEIDVLAKWIAGGLLDSTSSVAKAKKKSNFSMAANANPQAKPEGPPPMPENLLLDPVVVTAKPDSIRSMAHSPWAPLVAVAGEKQVLLYHAENGSLLGVLPFPEGNPECVGFSRNGSIVFAGGGKPGKSGVVALWEVKSGKRVATVGDEFDSVLACDITPDHKRVALGGPGRKLRIFDTATGQVLLSIKKHTDWILSIAFSPDGVLLASGDRNGGLYVWETSTGNEFYTLKGHEKAVTGISWRPDSNLVASSSEDGTVRWWEMQGGSQVKSWAAHGGAGVLSVSFGTDARLITGGRDGKARIFAPDGNQKREFVPANGSLILNTAFTPDGKRVLTGSWSGELKFWDAEKEPKDAPPLGIMVNPPSVDTRIASLTQELQQKQTAVQQAEAAAAEKEKAVAAAKNDASTSEQQLAAMQAEQAKAAQLRDQIKAAMGKLTDAKAKFAQELEAAKQQLAGLQKPQTPAMPPPGAVSEAVQSALQQANQAQAAAAQIATTLAETKVKDLTEVVSRQDMELAQMTQRMPQAEQQITAMAAKVAEMEKSMAPKKQMIDTAMKGYNDSLGAVKAAKDAVAQVQGMVQYWQAAKENKAVLVLTTEVDGLKDTVETLKVEIPGLEAEIKALTEQKGANPPPPAEKIAQMDKRLAAANKRLEAAKKELPTAEAQMAEKQKATEAARQKYQALLPK